ncbi:MAG TPA: serine hydrolase domain-containing protein [Agriterribacter sp.]|nr:beta-lactamase family protein [Chitinophagaceae bacterium]HRP30246.1 serine hydrolase domain-containing protein [Agriterribacter sp.]
MSYKFKVICLYFSLLSGFLLMLQPANGQYNFSVVDDMLQKNQKILGKQVVALVWKDGKIVYRKETSEEFTGKMQAPIAASGQWLTAAASMICVDEGKLSLDTKAGKLIPILAKYMKAYINLRHCLTHTTGLEGEKTGMGKLLPKSKFESLEEEINHFATKREIVTNPQTEFYYSHVGMNIAGRMLEVANRKTFDRIVQEKLLRPLKMRSTTFFNYDNLFINPSVGAQSSANDYMNFLVMLLNNGMFEGKRIISEKAIAEMEQAQFADLPVKYTPPGTEGLHYGLGAWLMEEDAQKRGTILCSPSFTGTWPFIDRKNNYAAILLVQSPSGEKGKEIYAQFKAAVDEALGL